MINGSSMNFSFARSHANCCAAKRARGMSLIEVMVSVLILSVGLLGIAAMQSFALRGGQGSLESSQAVMQTSSILESMRANRTVTYNMGKTCSVAGVTGSTLEANDRRVWVQALKDTIGNTADTCGQIACNAGLCTITVFWNDARAGSDQGGQNRSLQTSARI